MKKIVIRYTQDIHIQRKGLDMTYSRYNTTPCSWSRLNTLLNGRYPNRFLDLGRHVPIGEVYEFGIDEIERALLLGLYAQYKLQEAQYRHDVLAFRAGTDTQVYLSAMCQYWAGMGEIAWRASEQRKHLWIDRSQS